MIRPALRESMQGGGCNVEGPRYVAQLLRARCPEKQRWELPKGEETGG